MSKGLWFWFKWAEGEVEVTLCCLSLCKIFTLSIGPVACAGKSRFCKRGFVFVLKGLGFCHHLELDKMFQPLLEQPLSQREMREFSYC